MSVKKSMPELDRMDKESYAQIHNDGLVIVCDNLRSAHNVGSIFRTADSFGVSKIYLCGITCQIENRELMKTALGAELSVPSVYFSETIDCILSLKENGYQILSLEQTKNSLLLTHFQFDLSRPVAIVLGNEVEGVSEEVLKVSDNTLEIPQVGTKHSLNVTNAASILIWEYFKQTR